jgi:hypothetical protein
MTTRGAAVMKDGNATAAGSTGGAGSRGPVGSR